jgi:hypothetical protein
MALGKDFWLILRIIVAVYKALVEIFGDEEDKAEQEKNGF